MPRLFVALRPPPAIRAALEATMGGVPGARWQNDEQLHLTLRFIGEVDRHRAADIDAALAGLAAPPARITILGTGMFGSGWPRALWAGVGPDSTLAAAYRAVERGLVRVGFPPETRAFLPHVTLARLGKRAGPADLWLARTAGLSLPTVEIAHLTLFESFLGRDGAIYEPLARYPFSA